jgi:hypothetical protein
MDGHQWRALGRRRGKVAGRIAGMEVASFDEIAEEFHARVARIARATVATVGADGAPRTRVIVGLESGERC